jgi:hypothetical protein
MLTPSQSSLPSDAVIHDPSRRSLLLTRSAWEVRGVPGPDPLGSRWLASGLWHLQFFRQDAPASVLVFPDGAPVGVILVRWGGSSSSNRLTPAELDASLVARLGVPPASTAMASVVTLMQAKAIESLALSRLCARQRALPLSQ